MGSSWPQVFCIAITVSTLLLSHPQQAAGELQFLGERPFRAYASRLTPAGREIYQLFAIDGVSGNSNGTTFQFEETFALQPASRFFRLNSTTGELILNQVFSSLVDYVLVIEARSSSRTTVVRANITVTVVAESDSTPRYELENYNFSISEDISLNRPFSVVRAFSLPPSSFQNYAIIGGTSERNFAVDSDSGLLTVTRSLDREVVDTYTLILRYSCSTVYIDTLILIHVLDANDNSPQFSEIAYVVMILESTSVSTSVLTILATDADAGSNAIVSYSLMNEALLPFSLNPQSGVLMITSELDYERVEEYYLTIIALDGGELPRSSTVTVIVSLSNVDDECPIFENPFYSIEIPSSSLTSDQVILTITATDPDRAGDIRYSIMSSNDDGNVLSLDPMTGDISLANDNLGSVRGHYSLNVSASDESCSTFVQVDIGIGDENNHNPSFDTPCSASLSENPPLGTEIVTLTAIDGDVGQNGVITYTLVNTSFFSIDASSGVVRTTRSPHEYDRELQEVFRVGVIARDEKQGQDYCLLTITLLDQNDNRPQFNLPSYNFTLPSDSEVGTFLAQIWAYDEDRGENGTVVYSLSSTEMLFSIDENNGTITTMAGLGNVGYTFQVTATDTGQPTSLSSTAMVHVTPLTGNSFPVFNQLYYSTSLCENAPVHYTVLSVSASMSPQYEIIPGQNYDTNSIEGPFIISSSIIRVGSSVLVDYERLGPRKIFHFPVQAFNEGGSSFSIVEISVIDLDDNPPVIEEIRSFTLAENQPVGTKILQVLATDLDSGSNGNIAYNISINSPYFSVSSNGTITSSYRFDFENSSEVHSGTLRIEAYNPSQTDATIDMCGFGVFLLHERGIITISWSILDQNDNSPRFSQQMYSITLSEDQQIGNPIFSFTATDPDSSDGDGLIFMIRGGNDGRFAVESDMLLLVQRLDYEVKSNYSLIIEVTDGVHSGPTCADCRATLVINILNIDDEKPVFSAPFYYGEVEESAPLGTTVLTLLAHDPDSASISYRLSGSAEGRFSVTRSGDIVVSGLLDREEFPGGSIAFLATAESGGADVTEVNVTLLDVNDHAPRFLDVFGGRVQENVPQTAEDEGIFVVQVRASDLDQGRNGTVTYSLVSGMEDGFKIDPDSGILTAHAEYDKEAQPFHNVIVRATDNGLPTSLSTTTLVTVDIGDDNDNPPFFPFTFMFARIFEEAPIGSHVFSIPAVDLDNGTNASITYTLVSSDPSGRFELDSETGEVRVTQRLDYEVPLHRSTTLTIRISDPVFQGEMEGSLLIMLLDRNDNPPRVDPTMGGSDIRENLPPGRELARFTAVDDDAGENGNLIFSILNGNERGDFEISDTGEVRNLNTFDYEAVTRYNLTVLVSDQGTPPLSTAVQLEFNILDENDNPPTFSQPVYSVSVTEETQLSAPDILLQVTASDPDTGDGGTVQSYSIVSGDDSMRFHLNSTTGILSTSAVFDREELSSYSLIITANDRGIDSQTGTGMILVTITDINDTPSEEGGLLQVYIYARDGVISPRTIGPVYFADPDTSNSFENCVVQVRNAQVFETLGCDVVLDQPNPPTIANELNLAYTMTVQGDDGGGHVTVTADVVIMVDHISSSNIPGDDIVTITINATDKEYFTEGLNISLPSLLAQYLGTERSNLYVISVQQGFFDMTNTVDMTFSARKISGEFMSAVEIINILFLARNELFVGQYGVVSIPTDPCVTEPCFNQAECRIQRSVGETERAILTSQFILFSPLVTLSYQCDCVPGTAGRLCEINYSDCYSNPCSHGVECTDAVQGFICDCPEGTSGSDCSFNPDECSPRNPCLNGATCTNGFGTYVCECLPGYYGSECQYAHFQISSSCDSVSCQNGAACSPGRDGFTCLCPFGFSGDFCEEPVLIQGGCLRNPCYNGSSCTNSDDGPICHCSAGFTGPFCRWPLDNCELEPCQNGGTCEEGLYGSYVCTCPPGYTGTDCTDRVSACKSNPCVNGGRCTENLQIDSFSCQCSRFFTGSRCETSLITLDLCDEFLCSDFSNCTSSRDSYTCSCDPGYYGTDCSMTSDTSSSICSSNPCLHGGTCTLTGGNDEYICQCSNGFTGSNCEINIDDCNPDPCLNGGTCQDRIGGYICNCTEEGVTGNNCEVFCPAGQEGEFCERTIQYCTASSCLNNGTCIEVTGASACQCPQTHTGARCELNNSCATTQCLNGGACTSIPSGGSSCDCMPGFDGENCKLFTASFSGSASVSSFRALRPLQLQGQGEMTMEFTTMSQQGLLLYSTQYQGGMSRDLIAIEVVGGYLKISVSHGSGAGSATVMSSSVHVSDGRWHQVALQTNGKRFLVLLDQCQMLEEGHLALADCKSSATSSGERSFLNLGLPLWIGGAPSNILSSTTMSEYQPTSVGFTGCIRNLTINGQLLDLEDYVEERNSERGCTPVESSCTANGGEVCGEGSCQPSFEGFSCICPPLIAGDRCEEVAESLMFSGRGYAQYNLTDSTAEFNRVKRQIPSALRSTLTDQLSLRFRTELSRGILFQNGETNGTGDFYSLQLRTRGAVSYHINLGSGEETFSFPTSLSPVDDAEWHYLEVERNALALKLVLDNLTLSYTLGGNQLNLDVPYDYFYAGGSPVQSGSDAGNLYIGCLTDIRVDQNVLPTSGSNRFATVSFSGDTDTPGISTGCGLKGCFPDPCQGGNCTENGDVEFTCSCSDGSILNSSSCIVLERVTPFLLVIIIVALVVVLLLLLITGAIVMICWKKRNNRKFNLMHSVTPTTSEIILSTRDCVIITNDDGGGEEDTNMTDENWKRSCQLPRKEPLAMSDSSDSSNSINEPLTQEIQNNEICPPVLARAKSPVISAFIDKRLEVLRNEYRDIDSIREFEDEGDLSSNITLDSVCSYAPVDEEEYTVERLKKAGPEFHKFVGLLEALTAEEEGDMDMESEIVHTGQTQTQTQTEMGTQSQGGLYF